MLYTKIDFIKTNLIGCDEVLVVDRGPRLHERHLRPQLLLQPRFQNLGPFHRLGQIGHLLA
jgi:hypothetical protein